MKKFMNTCGILAVVMIVAGIAMVVVSGIAKGPDAISYLKKEAAAIIDKLDSGVRFNVQSDMDFEDDVPIIEGSTAQTFAAQDIRKLDAEIGACELNILPSEDENLYLHTEGEGTYQGYVKDGTLYLKAISDGNIGASLKDNSIHVDLQSLICEVSLFIPDNFYFEEVKLSLGAGTVSDNCSWEVGKLDVEMGAGEAKLFGVKANSLDAEVGAGTFTYTGSIFHEADIECGMGDILLELDDSAGDYNYDIEVAAGDVTVGNESFGGIAGERRIDNNAGKDIKVDCAMGSVEISFAD